MKVIQARNVNDALLHGIDLFNQTSHYDVQKAVTAQLTRQMNL